MNWNRCLIWINWFISGCIETSEPKCDICADDWKDFHDKVQIQTNTKLLPKTDTVNYFYLTYSLQTLIQKSIYV